MVVCRVSLYFDGLNVFPPMGFRVELGCKLKHNHFAHVLSNVFCKSYVMGYVVRG